jgi:glycosyltransferase involved in cell wall biosynthesis
VLCRTVSGKISDETLDGIQVHRIAPNRGPPWFFSLKKSVFESFCKQWNFDVFHSQGPCGAMIPVSKPLVVTLHGTSANEAKEIFRDLTDLPRLGIWNPDAYLVHALAVPSTYAPAIFLRSIVRRASRIIAVSRFVKEESQEVLNAPAEKIEVVYNGAQRLQVLNDIRSHQDSLIFFVGHLGVRKGLPYLISALSLIFEKNLNSGAVIAGEGPLKALCQYMSRKLKISHNVLFAGAVTDEERSRLYQAADLCVFPSTYEAFPLVTLEALAAGKPVVASNVGGIPEVVHNGVNGFLVRPRDARAIADAADKILSDKVLATKMSKNARQGIEKDFNWERIAEKTLSIYRSCTGEAS